MSDTLRQDLRFGLRTLRVSPGFAIVAIVTLGLGIGASSAIFSLFHGVLLEPLPYREPERLVRVFETHPSSPKFPVSPLNYGDYRRENRTLEGIGIYTRQDLQLADGGRPVRLSALRVSREFFEVLGFRPALGRVFEAEEEMSEEARVLILSDQLWRSRFQADPGIVGRTLRLDGRAWIVVGVMPAGFQHAGGEYRSMPHGDTVDLWWPVDLNPARVRRGWHYLNAVARLKPGVTVEQAAQDLNRIAADLEKRYPNSNNNWRIRVHPLSTEIVGPVQAMLMLLMTAVGLLLLIACANVASLMLARATARRREFAVRAAMGAGRWRLVRQVLTESLLLGVLGGALGLVLAAAGVRWLPRLMPEDFPRLHMIRLDAGVLLFAIVASLLTAILFGLPPALQGFRDQLARVLHSEGRSSGGRGIVRFRNLLVVAEVTLASGLLIASGLLLRSFQELLRTDPGFKPQGVLSFTISLTPVNYAQGATRAAFFAKLKERLEAIPGVTSAGAGSALPWSGWDENSSFTIVGDPPGKREPQGRFNAVTPGFFEALGVPLKAGRYPNRADTAQGAPMVVINESLARKYFADREPLGQKLVLWDQRPNEIVGVVGDVKDSPAALQAEPAFYWAHSQRPFGSLAVAVRTAGDPLSLLPTAREALREIDPELAMADVRTMDSVFAAAHSQRTALLAIMGVFAALALLLCGVGAYGVLAYSVELRQQEIGIRVALGARQFQIFGLVLRQGLLLGTAGLAAGLALAIGLGSLLQSLLYGVHPRDPVTYAGATFVTLVAACAASLIPALRAARSDPMATLRAE